MRYAKRYFIQAILTIACFSFTGIWQDDCKAQETAKKEEGFHPHHQLGVVISHAQVIEGRDENGKKKVLTLPSWGIDYTYHFHPKWGIGLHTDMIVEEFQAKGGHGEEVIERSYPIAPAVMGIYKPGGHWNFLLGLGAEFAKEDNFLLTRAGIEYSGELPKHWEVFGTLSYDFKWNAYDTWVIGIGIAKVLGKHKHK